MNRTRQKALREAMEELSPFTSGKIRLRNERHLVEPDTRPKPKPRTSSRRRRKLPSISKPGPAMARGTPRRRRRSKRYPWSRPPL